MEILDKLKLMNMENAEIFLDTLLTIIEDLEPCEANKFTEMYSTREIDHLINQHVGIRGQHDKITMVLKHMGFQNKQREQDLVWLFKNKTIESKQPRQLNY
jgi:uncharacterized protein Smg (DUF494 family)